QVSSRFQQRLRALGDHPLVGETRGIGLIGAIEIVSDKPGKTPFAPQLGVGAGIQAKTMAHGVIVRSLRDAVAFCPPLIINEAEIDQLFDAVEKALDETADQTRAA